MAYDIFISYSHAADGQLGPALRTSLQRFAKPWYRRRALSVFIDEASLAASNDLPAALHRAATDARFFVYLASPQAANSRWVGEELALWRVTHESSHCLIALTDGAIAWDESRQDFDLRASTAIHPQFAGMFRREPLWADLRWVRSGQRLSARDPRFQRVIAMLAAPVHGRPLDELVGEDVKQHARTKRVVGLVIGGLSVLLVLLAVTAFAATRTAFTLQRRLQLISTLLPFYDDPQLDGERAQPTVASALRILMSTSDRDVEIDWNAQPELVVAREDCHASELPAGASPPEGCPGESVPFGEDGLRTDVPHLPQVAARLVDDINSGHLAELARALYEEDVADREVAETRADDVIEHALSFAPILLPSPLWQRVRLDGREEREPYFGIPRKSVSTFVYPLRGGESDLIFLRLMDAGYCGSGGCTVPVLAYLRQADTVTLVWIGDVFGQMTLSEAGDGNLPRLFTLSLSQSGAFDQYRRLDRYEFNPEARTYLHVLQGTVRGIGAGR